MQVAGASRALNPALETLGDVFVSACTLRKERSFLIDEEMRLNGADALQLSQRLATALHTIGLGAGDKIAFLSRPSVLHTLALFSAIRIGAVATNLHLLETLDRMADTISWLESKVVVYDDEFGSLADSLSGRLPDTRFVPLVQLAKSESEATIAIDGGTATHPVAIVLSSGSTGRPKGVLHTHASVLNSIGAGDEVYRGLDANDSVLVCIGTSFGGWCNVVPPFLGLATRLVFQRRFAPHRFLKGLADEQITIAPLVPTMWRIVLASEPERYDLSTVKLPFMSGEMASRSDVEQVRSRITPRVRAAYLSTEGACGCGIVADEDQFLTEEPARGRPLTCVGVRIIAASGPIDHITPSQLERLEKYCFPVRHWPRGIGRIRSTRPSALSAAGGAAATRVIEHRTAASSWWAEPITSSTRAG